MILLPIRTDRRLHSFPWMNVALIAANVIVFVLMDRAAPEQQERLNELFALSPTGPRLMQFITYQFIHAGWLHLGGNMLFLYVFGNSVEDRLGKVGYLAFYLSGGVLAGLGYCLLEQAPVVGASGSIAAVTGAYLALFPASNVTIGYFFFFIGVFEISSIYLILFQIGENLFLFVSDTARHGQSGVAYMAHLAGYAYGFFIGMTLLWTRILPREPYDLLTLIEHRRRRAHFASLTRQGYRPWEGPTRDAPTGGAPAPATAQPPTARDTALMDLRGKVAAALARHDMAAAADAYERLLEADAGQVLSAQAQLDVANQFATEKKYELAARAYELYLGTFRSEGQRDQIELILALIYARYLHRFQRARELLLACLPRLTDPQLREMAQQTLAQVNA